MLQSDLLLHRGIGPSTVSQDAAVALGAVPEAETYVLLLVGLGVITATVRIRRRGGAELQQR